jgi:hypothetical protein
MADLNGFDANDYDPSTSFDPIPAGKYVAAITASEMKPTKRKDGSYLELEFEVLEGPYQGRKVWDRLCINHPNELTQKIARSNLSAICRAVGVLQPQDSTDLHNVPLTIRVRCTKRSDSDEMDNEVKGYAAREASQGTPQQAPADDGTPPWKR